MMQWKESYLQQTCIKRWLSVNFFLVFCSILMSVYFSTYCTVQCRIIKVGES